MVQIKVATLGQEKSLLAIRYRLPEENEDNETGGYYRRKGANGQRTFYKTLADMFHRLLVKGLSNLLLLTGQAFGLGRPGSAKRQSVLPDLIEAISRHVSA